MRLTFEILIGVKGVMDFLRQNERSSSRRWRHSPKWNISQCTRALDLHYEDHDAHVAEEAMSTTVIGLKY